MNKRNIELLMRIPTMRALELTRAVAGEGSTLLEEVEAELNKEYPDTNIMHMVDAACVNPCARVIFHGVPCEGSMSQLLYGKLIRVGVTSPDIFKWLVDATLMEYNIAYGLGLFVDLNALAIETDSKEPHTTGKVLTPYGNIEYDPARLFTEEKLKEWWTAFCTYSPMWDFRISDEIWCLYRNLWIYCEDKFGEVVTHEHMSVTTHTVFGDYPLDVLKVDMSQSSIFDDSNRRSFCVDLNYMSQALEDERDGKKEMNVCVHIKGQPPTVYTCKIDEMLSHDRLRLLAEGFLSYMNTQVLYYNDSKNYSDDYANYITHLPGEYMELFNYILDVVCTPEERFNTVVPECYSDVVLGMIPNDWMFLDMEDLREILREALESIRNNR